MLFIPNSTESSLIQKITKAHPEEYALVRLTPTMLHKAIIDASAIIRSILKYGGVIDYDYVNQGPEEKVVLDVFVLTSEINIRQASFYRPNTKKGDPRLWIYGLKDFIKEEEMIFLTVHEGKLIIIPLTSNCFNENIINEFFGSSDDEAIKSELIELLTQLNAKGPVKSVSPTERYAKDVGDTFERELGILPNPQKIADFKSQIELKAKREGTQTKDTLFSMVPDWSISQISSSNEMIQTYGYPSKKYDGFLDLFVTVSNKKNNQGLYLEVDEENHLLHQLHKDENGKKLLTASWKLDEVKQRLQEKHPETVWVIAEEIEKNGEIYFHYKKAEYTRAPIFSSFLLLIMQGIVTYDWRGRVKIDGTGYKDKGHCFRLTPKYRNLLFNEIETIELCS